jgi:hypothetical protein
MEMSKSKYYWVNTSGKPICDSCDWYSAYMRCVWNLIRTAKPMSCDMYSCKIVKERMSSCNSNGNE